MKTGKGCKGILRQGMIVVSLTLLFFTIITVMGFGTEKIQAEKVFSEYSKNPHYTYISNDFKKLLILDKDLDLDEEDVSYWDIDGKEDPVLIWEKRKKYEHMAERAYSPDLRYYAEPKGDTIYIKRMKDDLLVNKIVLPINPDPLHCEIKLSNDNSKLVVLNTEYPEGKKKDYIRLYDIKSAELIDDIYVSGNDSGINGFSFDDKYIGLSGLDYPDIYTFIYSIEKEANIFLDVANELETKYGNSFIEEDLLYILNHMRDSGNKFIEVIDVSKGKALKGEVIKTYNNFKGSPRLVTDFLGSTYDGTSFNELIAMGDQLVKYKTHQIDDEDIKKIAYNKEKEEWVIVGQNKVHYIPTDAGDARESFEQYAGALELLEIGFEEGVDRVKETLAEVSSTALAQNNGRFLREYDLTLKQRAELVLAEYNCLMAGDMPDNYDMLYAHRKLFEYGLLAVRAGYPQFTLQVAELLRGLKAKYPAKLLWDKVDKHIILLEALAIAVRDGSEAGFKHMLDNEGILYDDNQNYLLDIYLYDYSEYFAPLLSDKKKMSYFTKIAENKLPSVQMWEQGKLKFIDLMGNEISGVEGMQGNGEVDENGSGVTNDSGSGDDNSSDSGSAGSVLD